MLQKSTPSFNRNAFEISKIIELSKDGAINYIHLSKAGKMGKAVEVPLEFSSCSTHKATLLKLTNKVVHNITN